MTTPLALTIGAVFYIAWVSILHWRIRRLASRGNPFRRFADWQVKNLLEKR